MAKETVMLDAGDVSVKKKEQERCECGKPITHVVWLDLRNNGIATVFVEACKACAEGQAKRLRESLPKEEK